MNFCLIWTCCCFHGNRHVWSCVVLRGLFMAIYGLLWQNIVFSRGHRYNSFGLVFSRKTLQNLEIPGIPLLLIHIVYKLTDYVMSSERKAKKNCHFYNFFAKWRIFHILLNLQRLIPHKSIGNQSIRNHETARNNCLGT